MSPRPAKSKRSAPSKKAAKPKPRAKAARPAKPIARTKKAKPTKQAASAQAFTLPTAEQIAATIAEAQRQVMAAAVGGESMKMDPGTVSFLSAFAKTGEHIALAAVADRHGKPIFSTTGTRWNVHGVEQFENGTSLYLHHLDHPCIEQRVIIWPPDTGTFESFGESMPLAALGEELHKRDDALTKKPAAPFEPPASYFRDSVFKPRKFYISPPDRDGERPPFDPERFVIDAEPAEAHGERLAAELVISFAKTKDRIFDLVGSGWDARVEGSGPLVNITLRPPFDVKKTLKLTIDLENFVVRLPGQTETLPIDWVQRHIHNSVLYLDWEVFLTALKVGPRPEGVPDIVMEVPGGFTLELWPGEVRHALPFLHPRIVDKKGQAIFDARASQWGAMVDMDEKRPLVVLRLVSTDIAEREDRFAGAKFALTLDLVSRRAIIGGMDGGTFVGRLQEMVQRVRGVKWLLEELQELANRGKPVPLPKPTGSR
ncbi:MAG: hypothetical protein ACREJO_12360 [Phycisphaerales bacterium]